MNLAYLQQAAGAVRGFVARLPQNTVTVVEKHKGIRRGLVVWSACLITWVTVRVFTHGFDQITGNVVAAYSITAGTLGTVLALYHIGRSREDCQPGGP